MTGEEFQRSGLLWIANRALHPFGVAVAVTVDEDGSVADELTIETTDDPTGFVFTDADEDEGRRRLAAWIKENWNP